MKPAFGLRGAGMRYRKKPVIIDAFQFMGHDAGLEPDWFVGAVSVGTIVRYLKDNIGTSDRLTVQTPGCAMPADLRDWIIRGIKGELDVCKPDIFEQSYEAVDETKT